MDDSKYYDLKYFSKYLLNQLIIASGAALFGGVLAMIPMYLLGTLNFGGMVLSIIAGTMFLFFLLVKGLISVVILLGEKNGKAE